MAKRFDPTKKELTEAEKREKRDKFIMRTKGLTSIRR